MIGKIDAQILLPSESRTRAPAPGPGKGMDFHSLLRGKLDEFQPLEPMIIQVLSRALESILGRGNAEDGTPFLALPLFSPSEKNMGPPLRPSLSEFEIASETSENLAEKQNFDPIIQKAGEKYGVEPSLIRAVIQTESSGNPLAVSPAGARGLMQLMPKTAAELGVHDSFDPAENVMGGTRYLRRLLDRYQGDRKLALAAYNWGMGNVEARLDSMPRETRNYIAKVENLYQAFSRA